jgi:sarcosine oxidase subunit beta
MPEAEYRPIGYLFYVPQSDWDAQLRDVAMQRALGAPVEAIDLTRARSLVPADPHGLAGATWCAEDGIVDPHGICLGYVARARAAGARFAFGQAIEAIGHEGGDWVASAPGLRVAAPRLVNAAGAWSGSIAAMAGLEVPVEPARRMVFTTAPLPSSLVRERPYPLTIDLGTGLWFRSERDRLIIGLANEADRGFSEGIDWPWLENTIEAALPRFPWFEQLAIDRRACWWGYYENTPDHNPVIGRMPDAPGWINACGFSGHGVQHAAAVGRIVAQEVLGEPTFIDIDALRIERFARRGEGGTRGPGERLVV